MGDRAADEDREDAVAYLDQDHFDAPSGRDRDRAGRDVEHGAKNLRVRVSWIGRLEDRIEAVAPIDGHVTLLDDMCVRPVRQSLDGLPKRLRVDVRELHRNDVRGPWTVLDVEEPLDCLRRAPARAHAEGYRGREPRIDVAPRCQGCG